MIVKEVGWGISADVARQLVDAGVAAIDVGGAGGTSWSEVERHRAPTDRLRRVAGAFDGWGIPTADSLVMVRAVAPTCPLSPVEVCAVASRRRRRSPSARTWLGSPRHSSGRPPRRRQARMRC